MGEPEQFEYEIEGVLALIVDAIQRLDAVAAPADIAAHLDAARVRMLEVLAFLRKGENLPT